VEPRAPNLAALSAHPSNVRDLEVESEPMSLAASKDKTRKTLRRHGAIGEETDFLGGLAHRVERDDLGPIRRLRRAEIG
jgi:hypothetical protein